MQEYFKIGELSRLYGIGVDSLRYYERIGILKPQRSESGYRLYSVQDIWKLNIIRDLRELGFSMEAIRTYLEKHSVASTLAMLQQEQEAIEERICHLTQLRENVSDRLQIIRNAQNRPMNRYFTTEYPERRCYVIQETYSDEREMDVLIKQLINMDKEHLYVIGSNQIGTAISARQARETGKVQYQAVFVIDPRGQKVLPAGEYLSVCYRGDYSQSRDWVRRTLDYAEQQGLRLAGDFLEILWIDIHTSADVQEFVTELQIRVEKA